MSSIKPQMGHPRYNPYLSPLYVSFLVSYNPLPFLDSRLQHPPFSVTISYLSCQLQPSKFPISYNPPLSPTVTTLKISRQLQYPTFPSDSTPTFLRHLTITYCSGSRRRAEKVDKRMVLECTHGLFIT